MYKSKLRKRHKRNKRHKIKTQKGGFIGSIFNLVTLPVKLVAKPIYNKLSNIIFGNNGNQNGNQNGNNQNGNQNGNNQNGNNQNGNQNGNNVTIDKATLTMIRLNNTNISSLKDTISNGNDIESLKPIINKLKNINI